MYMSGSLKSLVFLLFVVLFAHGARAGEALFKKGPPSPAEIEAALTRVRGEIGAFPSDLSKEPEKELYRSVLKRREALLQEYRSLLSGIDALAQEKKGLAIRMQTARERLAALGERGAPTIPPSPDKTVFDRMGRELAKQQEQVAALNRSMGDLRRRMTESDALILAVEERAAAAEKTAERLAATQVAQSGGSGESARNPELDNALLENRTALLKRKLLETEADLHRNLEPVSSLELELARKQLELLEADYAAYGRALGSRLVSEKDRMETELRLRDEAVAAATGPAERFLALREKELFISRKSAKEMQAFLVELRPEVTEQEKRLAAEQEELAGFRDLLGHPEAYRRAGDRIRSTIQQLKRRRLLLLRPVRAGFAKRLQACQERRYTVDDTLFSLNETRQEESEELSAGLSEQERREFSARSESLLSDFRTVLREEKNLLTEVITLGQRLQRLSVLRLDNIGEHERFIRSKVFWLQDVKPLGIKALRPLASETAGFFNWMGDLAAGKKGKRLLTTLKRPMALFYLVLLLFAGPAFLLFLLRRLERALKLSKDAWSRENAGLRKTFAALLAAVTGPAVTALYCLLLARLTINAGFPADVKSVLSTTLEQTGFFLFFLFLTRNLFGARGLLPRGFHMHEQAARALYKGLCRLLLLYIGCLLPWRILSQPPFAFEALPRIFSTLFQLLGAAALLLLIRPASPWVRHSLETASPNVVSAHWRGISRVFTFLIVSVILMDLAGYRYGAQSIAESSGLSLATLMLFPSLYTAAATYAAALYMRLKRSGAPEPGDEPDAALEPKIPRFLYWSFAAALAVLLCVYWGVDRQALKTLEDIQLYRIRGEGGVFEFVTATDLMRAGLYLGVTLLLLRGLPRFYDLAIMPRFRLDEGMKYAILTLCRYGIFIVGLLFTLAEIHLDLGRLGWLVAAMGVGLGFGLQEIVSNFVCGIILLTERPIQVNDVVTVGGITGTIRKINIRATTLVNFDRQEVILPNRSLITGEVINWTKSDTINRLVIRIGVAYGSDVDKVTELLRQIALESPRVLADPSPVVVFMQHGDSSLDFELRVYTPSPDDRVATLDRINKEISRKFAEHGIEIPFPQRDLHVRSGAL